LGAGVLGRLALEAQASAVGPYYAGNWRKLFGNHDLDQALLRIIAWHLEDGSIQNCDREHACCIYGNANVRHIMLVLRL
jgi:hypothetical protein